MFHVLLGITIAIGVGLGAEPQSSSSVVVAPVGTNSASLLDGTQSGGALLDGTKDAATTPTGDWQPEPQIPTGKFTTATEVKPILAATKTAWLALREYDGNDLLYFTHLAAWRCGLHEIRFSLNGGSEQVFEVEECYTETAQPNALKMETHLPYITYELGSVDSVSVTVIFDDGTTDAAEYQRKDILMP